MGWWATKEIRKKTMQHLTWWTYLLLDHIPDNSGHFISIHLSNGIVHLNLGASGNYNNIRKRSPQKRQTYSFSSGGRQQPKQPGCHGVMKKWGQQSGSMTWALYFQTILPSCRSKRNEEKKCAILSKIPRVRATFRPFLRNIAVYCFQVDCNHSNY